MISSERVLPPLSKAAEQLQLAFARVHAEMNRTTEDIHLENDIHRAIKAVENALRNMRSRT